MTGPAPATPLVGVFCAILCAPPLAERRGMALVVTDERNTSATNPTPIAGLAQPR